MRLLLIDFHALQSFLPSFSLMSDCLFKVIIYFNIFPSRCHRDPDRVHIHDILHPKDRHDVGLRRIQFPPPPLLAKLDTVIFGIRPMISMIKPFAP
jgi:hypothetical protein